MALTTEQLSALKTAINLVPEWASLPNNEDTSDFISKELDKLATPDYFVWKTSVETGDLFDAIIWANLTPNPAPDGTAAWTNRSLACQGKQFNLQTILTGRATINPSKSRIRNGLQDALVDVPSGNNGTLRQAGWTDVLPLLYRRATKGEKIFAIGAGTVVSPSLLVIEGIIARQDVFEARAS
jgi:hypothetical protein